jgi:hypothetical protein
LSATSADRNYVIVYKFGSERALAHPKVTAAVKKRLRDQYRSLDPVTLLAEIRATQDEHRPALLAHTQAPFKPDRVRAYAAAS